jgi:hypothetical protein
MTSDSTPMQRQPGHTITIGGVKFEFFSLPLPAVVDGGFNWAHDYLIFIYRNGEILVNGVSYGTVQDGDYVRFRSDGTVLVNTQSRTPR